MTEPPNRGTPSYLVVKGEDGIELLRGQLHALEGHRGHQMLQAPRERASGSVHVAGLGVEGRVATQLRLEGKEAVEESVAAVTWNLSRKFSWTGKSLERVLQQRSRAEPGPGHPSPHQDGNCGDPPPPPPGAWK